MSEKRSVGDDVLEDLDALIKSGGLDTVAPPSRSYATPTKLGREMLEGAGPTIARQKEVIGRYETERAGGMVVLRLDPRRIRPSAFANRHQRSLDEADPAFIALKADIQRRGQLEPIRVRSLSGANDADYEIVYGHRRHAVALALNSALPGGFPVLALLDATADDAREHVLRMHSENFARSDLTPYEYGQMYASWLAAKCFKNQEEIAAAVGLDQSMISSYVRIFRLPPVVLAAFGDPRVISVRWSRELAAALKLAEAKVLASARAIAERAGDRDAASVMRELVEASRVPKEGRAATKTETIKVRGKTLYTINQSGGRLLLKFGTLVDPELAAEARDELKEHLTRWLSKRVKP
jgi:ParB family chromosome partitioning protein